MIRVPSPAKLNLFLHITGRRDNGYHELQTIFQLIDLYDWLEFEVNDYQIGFEKFQNLLKQFDLVHEPPKNKVQRFFEYQAQL